MGDSAAEPSAQPECFLRTVSVSLADKQIVSCLLWSKGVFSREYERDDHQRYYSTLKGLRRFVAQ